MNNPNASGFMGEGMHVLWKDGDRIFCRGSRRDADGDRDTVLAVLPATEHPPPASLDRLAHEYGLRDELDAAWALRPLELVRQRGLTMLLLEDPGSEPLGKLLGELLELGRFLRLAIGIASALGKAHRRGLVHKDIKPANIFVNCTTDEARLTGFGIASRLLRERPGPEPPETIAGTLAYMSPEQTGRMNRSVDARSDLYSLGITLYEVLTGCLPFTASDPMGWVHCHVARKPMAPSERLDNIPVQVSHIIMKLLAKTAEERYQTAAGLEHDLDRCLRQWETRGRIDEFPLGERDISDRLLIREKLYGREREVEALLSAFNRIVMSGAPELVLVSGYSGIGKSSVVNELHKALVPTRGLFAAGKFDQYKRDIPYSTIAQAFEGLIRPLLGKGEAELTGWRDALGEALGPNGRLVVDLIPELKLLIGEQPPVPELPPQQAQGRLHLVFRRFLGVFARPEHPLTLFLDDLQWLDAATLDMLAYLLTQTDVQHLLVIGAYRDNEVDSTHPLRRKLDVIGKAGAIVQEIRLAPLAREDLGQLVADTLSCLPPVAAPLAGLVHEKTGGNPFFAIQFMSAIAEEGLLRFDHDALRWHWELDRLNAKGYTDNVADLMVEKLTRLPVETQAALQQLACLGNAAETTMLSMVVGKSDDDVRSYLWDAVRLELVEQLEGSYKFIHDRVQEAAYSLIPKRLRAEAHLHIGKLLEANTPVEKREEAIFEIVNQLNRGADLITSREEREQLAELNLVAGQRAKASAAYASALTYLAVGAAQLPQDSWERRHELAFALELQRSECEFLTGALAEAEQRLATLSSHAASIVEQARVACLRVDLYTTLDQSSRAVAVGLDYLRYVGIDWSPHPTKEDAQREYERIWSRLGSRAIESLIDLPLMSDPASLATMDVLTKLGAPAGFADANLYFLVLSRAVNLSLERGNSDGSCFAYAWLGGMVGARYGDYNAGFRFAQLGYELVEQRGLRRFQAKTYTNFGSLVPWTRHILAARDVLRRAFEAANRIGALTDAAFSSYVMITNLLAAGDPLIDVQREAERACAFAEKMGFGLVIDIATTQLGLVRTLRGLTPKFGSFDDKHFEEARVQRRFSSNPDLARAECWYWIRKAQARFLSGEHAAAVDASSKAQQLLWASPTNFEVAEHCFYGALSNAACCGTGTDDHWQQHVEALTAYHHRLELWARNCPENFENRAALVGAEIARIEGRELDAEQLYERSIRSARANGFVQQEALANELAARFYAARGFDKISHVYLQDARYAYLRWGADGKVRQLDELYPHLREREPTSAPTNTIGTSVEHLDLATVIKVSQAVSGEIVLEALIDTLMRTAIEQAGAERGLLILARGAEPRIEAEATIADTVVVQLREQPVTASVLPESVFHYVLRTRESVILDDAAGRSEFAADPYLRERQARSILCLPLLNQAKLIGVLYLENTLTTRAFAPGRSAALKLLASQAAIALENAHLYRDLERREAKIRRLVDANIIGIYLWELEGRIIEANDTFLRMVGFDRDDLVSGRMLWTDLTPPEGRDRTARAVEEMKITGTSQPFEKEYFRKDGSRVPVLIGAANFDEQRDHGVAFVLDLTDRKQAEESLHKTQMELAHANRVATMGQLTASIAHEIKQPLTATVVNAQAAMRWLEKRPPDLEEVRQALGRIEEVGHRAGDIVGRIRALIQKAPAQKDRVDLNAAILEVIEFTRGEAVKNGISVRAQFADTLPTIHGDRVQLQQVVMNLVINAIEAMSGVSGPARELLVRTGKPDAGGVLVAVMDSGPGLSTANLERLFDAFYTTKPGGLGMGLSICRSIIDAHGGQLWASAKIPHGAVFQFFLPEHQG